MSITVGSSSKEVVEKDLNLDSESSMEDPVEISSTEKLTSPHKDVIHLLLRRAQKAVENGFLRCCCQESQDSVEVFLPPSKTHYVGLESPQTQREDTTPGSDVTCISEQRRSNSIPECSGFVLPGEVPVESIGASDSQSLHKTRANITTLEDNVEQKSEIDKGMSWKKTRSFFRRACKAIKLPLVCSVVDTVETSVSLTDSTEAQCGDSTHTLNLEESSDDSTHTLNLEESSNDSTHTLNLEESSDGILSGTESFPLPTEASGMEEISTAEKPTEMTKKERICYYLKKAWKGWV
ncbi:uncharacterized protein LOC143724234 [Siphateles boraxobius]|uniref:uncharacterized protein LOC143724234 n=1 Tax=Siphateles boraxobius TaxID=180520 RepID=UPI00406347A8